LIAFAHRPHDARSSCIAFLPESQTPQADLANLFEIGVPFAFCIGPATWGMWSLRSNGPQLQKKIATKDVERFFEINKADFCPGSVFRAKTWARAEGARQLDFVDIGLLPVVEKEAGKRLRQLFEDMLGHTMDALEIDVSKLSEANAHWLVKANFWLLAGKLLKDKAVPRFIRLDLRDVEDVFYRVAEHYGAQRIRANGRLTALNGAAGIAENFSSLRSISTETLGALYEESLLSERTRKLLSVHRTPTFLVDFMLAKVSQLIERGLDIHNCRFFEPACGHAPFLVGAVRVLSELLPSTIASDRVARRQFLRTHIGGCDRDSFSLEIARLSLTLADIPNPDGWKLDAVEDMYEGDYLGKKIAANSVIVANPPFENVKISHHDRDAGDLRFARSGQAGELLRRIIINAMPGTIFSIVIPQTLLDGSSFRRLRKELLSNIEINELVTFPDDVFKFARPETAVLIGRKIKLGEAGDSSFKFRRVHKSEMDAFRNENRVPSGELLSNAAVLANPEHQLLFPPLSAVWKSTEKLPLLQHVAMVTIGFYFYSEEDPDYPQGEIQISPNKRTDFYQGFRLAERSPDTHLLPRLEWLNQKPAIIRRQCGGTERGHPRIVMNHVRTGIRAWRHKAFIDLIGRPATDAFLLISPIAVNWSLEVLWAIANGPLASAFTFTNSATKQIGVRLLKRMPVPVLDQPPIKLETAVKNYISSALEYTSKFGRIRPDSELRKRIKKSKSYEGPELPLGELTQGDLDSNQARERLRALHWRVDAEVLKLYALPAQNERALLNFFDGVKRFGVPFDQTRYIPLGFTKVQRLDEFVLITDEWNQTDERRCELIEKRIKYGSRTPAEQAEFKKLQELFEMRRAYLRWRETGDADSPLFDEKRMKVLQQEDAR
jgi:hypothetical protein